MSKSITIKISEDLQSRLQAISDEENISLDDLVRESIR